MHYGTHRETSAPAAACSRTPSAKDMGKVEPSWCPEQQKSPLELCTGHLPNALAINSGLTCVVDIAPVLGELRPPLG